MNQQLQRLDVSHFRSHASRGLELGPVTAIVGPNGAGKTNLLEALWFLATTRSFRAVRETEMIAWGQPALHVVVDEYEIRLAQEPRVQKAVRIRGVAHRPLEYLGELRAILFTPDSLNIVSGSPAERRRFIDTLLSQRERETAQALLRYRRVLNQRNALLRLIAGGRASASELEPWDQQLVSLGVAITSARIRVVDQLAGPVERYYHDISGQPAAQLRLIYRPSIDLDMRVFRQQLAEIRDREVAAQITLIGPHRDDLAVDLDGHPAASHASRGETRSIVLALKWAESDLVQDADHRPLLLLDDLFSELDGRHRDALQQLLVAHQTVCTTTDPDNLPQSARANASLVDLSIKGPN